MTDPIAVLVMNDAVQCAFTMDVLQKLRFDVRSFDAITPVRHYLDQSSDLIDLFVLDRRLSMTAGGAAANKSGDRLLADVKTRFRDARILVFTHSAPTASYVQEALKGGGQLLPDNPPAIDRVTVLGWKRSTEFQIEVAAFRKLVQCLDDIEVTWSTDTKELSYRDKRAVRRLAFQYRSTSVAVTQLGGGLTGDSVWSCDLSDGKAQKMTFVAKRVKTRQATAGLPFMLPRVRAAATLATLEGMLGGSLLNVLQPAGKGAYPLMRLIDSDPAKAVRVSRPLWDELHAVGSERKILTVADLCKSLIDWDQLTSLLAAYEIPVPSGTLRASMQEGLRHGDFHPLNVLVDGDDAVLIDYDGNTESSGLEDPMTLLLSTLTHPASPIRSAGWPTTDEISATFGSPEFGRSHAKAVWFTGVNSWLLQCRTSERELWAWTLAYAGHELNIPKIREDPEIMDRVIAIARRAAVKLGET